MPILTLVPLVLQFLVQGLPVAESLYTAALNEYNLVMGGGEVTAEQQAAFDAESVAAHAALQAVKTA